SLIFATNVPTDTSSIYDSEYFFGGNVHGGYVDYDAEKEAMKSTMHACLAKLSAAHAKGRLLDIGAATGSFVAMANADGWDAEGLEISPAAVEAGKKKGLRMTQGVLTHDSYAEASFDAVTFFDVLEHVPDPNVFLADVRRILKSDG